MQLFSMIGMWVELPLLEPACRPESQPGKRILMDLIKQEYALRITFEENFITT